MSDTSLSFDFKVGRDTATPHMARVAAAAQAMDRTIQASGRNSDQQFQRTGREIFKIDNVFRNTARRFASHALLIGGAIIAASGHAVAFTYAIWPMVGALAAIPAVAVGAAIGLGSLLAVFSGLGAAMRRTAGGGGAAAATDALTSATRRYELAQRSATDAQNDLNEARQEAARRLADVSRELAAAALDEEAATLGVARAEQRLREARSSGDRLDRAEADLALRQSIQTLDDVRLRIKELKAEEADRTAKGIEGSDEVQDALQRQADATYELAQAQKALTDAQTGPAGGGVDKAAEAYAKLSPAGRELVDVLRAIGPAWRSVQQSIQQAALVGVAGSVAALSTVLLAQQGHLVAIGAGWNTAFQGIASVLTSEQGAADLNVTLGNTAAMAQHLGEAWAPFTRGFLDLVTVGSDFLPRLGAWIQDLATRFADWATAARESGRMHAWIENAIAAAKDFGAIIRDVSAAIGSIFKAGSGGPNYLADLAADAARFREAMASPEAQARMAAFFTAARDLGSALWTVIKSLLDVITRTPNVIGAITGAFTIVGAVLAFAATHAELLNQILPPLITGFLAYKSILLVIRTATMIWTAAQWLLNVALTANPIGLIIVAIVALVAAFIWLWNNVEGFRNFFIGAWEHIWGFLKMIGAWFAGPFVDFWVGAWNFLKGLVLGYYQFVFDKFNMIVDFVTGLPGRIASAASGMWDGIVYAFKSAVNWMISLWNNFQLTLGGGSVAGMTIPSITLSTPDIPYLDSGGFIRETGVAVVHKGEEVIRAAQVERSGGGGAAGVRIEFSGPRELQEMMKLLIRRIVRTDGGGDVQVTFGTG